MGVGVSDVPQLPRKFLGPFQHSSWMLRGMTIYDYPEQTWPRAPIQGTIRKTASHQASLSFSIPATSDHFSLTTTTSLSSRYMLDERQVREPNANDASLPPRTMYLPELDMEIMIPPRVQVPRRELPVDNALINSRVKLLRTSVAFGGVSFPKPCPLPKPPR